MKTVVYLGSVLLFLSSCFPAKEFYDDVYDSAEKPESVIINPDAGYADYIKDAEDDNQVVIDRQTLRPDISGFVNKEMIDQLDNGCDCDCRFIPNSVFYDLSGMTPRLLMFNEDDYFGDCGCCKDIFMRRYQNYAIYYQGHGQMAWMSRYAMRDIWGHTMYSPWGCGYAHNSYFGYYGMYNVDPFFYGGYYDPYNYYGWTSWSNGYGYGNTWGSWGYWGNGWGNSNGWFAGNNGAGSNTSTQGNHHYGHHGHVATGSSNTTNYLHTVKETSTDEVGINITKPETAMSSGVVFGEIRPAQPMATGTIATTNDLSTASSGTSNQVAGKGTPNVPAANPFATGVGRTNTSSGTNNSGVNPNGTTRPLTTTTGTTTDYVNEYERYVEPTTSANTSSNSTSRTSGTTYDSQKNTYRPSAESGTSNSNANTSYGHRTSVSGGSGSTTGSTSGGSRSTTTSRR